MKIHEYQAKDILAKYGVAVPRGEVANTLDEALEVAKRLFAEGAKGVVVKAQIHAGGRGKGGGVKVAKTLEEAEQYAKQILGMQLITHQTGPQGQKVQRLLIEETAAIDRELYLGIVLDRAAAKLVFMASQAGGMEIEEVAAKTPEAIYKEAIDPAVGFGAWQARKLAFAAVALMLALLPLPALLFGYGRAYSLAVIVLAGPLIFVLLRELSKPEANFSRAQKLLKLLMLAGMIALLAGVFGRG